jgi:hypothetical protein
MTRQGQGVCGLWSARHRAASPRHACSQAAPRSGVPSYTSLGITEDDLQRPGRGRDAGYPAPPAQIPACSTTAPGSCLGS